MTHEGIETLFKCTRCDSRFYKTYEIMTEGQKWQTWGLYS
jgi:hypothetical protein